MTLKKQILYILEQYPETRNSDIALTIKIWQHFTKKLVYSERNKAYYVKVNDLYEMQREDHIRRVRAKIQNEEGLFLPTDPKVIKIRKQQAKIWRKNLGYRTQEDNIRDFYKQKNLNSRL